MSNPRNTPEPHTGAVPVAGRPARRKWLLPLLLALLAVIALLLLLSRCGGDDAAKPTSSATSPAAAPPVTATSVSPPAASTPTSGGQSGAGPNSGPGTVTAAGTNLLDAAASGTSLTGHHGQKAVGHGARVQSVPADEGFWVGTSDQDRIWVQLSGTGGESDYKVKQGDAVDFTGTIATAAPGFAAKTGLTEAEGAGQLTKQGVYVSVPSSSVKLSR